MKCGKCGVEQEAAQRCVLCDAYLIAPLAIVERRVIVRAVAAAGSQKRAAELLGVSRNTLRNRLHRWGLTTQKIKAGAK